MKSVPDGGLVENNNSNIKINHNNKNNGNNKTKHEKEMHKLKEDLKKSSKKFVIFVIINLLIVILMTLIFFYIEHCYDPISVREASHDLWELCNLLHEQNSKNTTSLNTENTSNTTSSVNTTKTSSVNTTNSTILTKLCVKGIEQTKMKCELTETLFFKYFDYSSSILFTVGSYSSPFPEKTIHRVEKRIQG